MENRITNTSLMATRETHGHRAAAEACFFDFTPPSSPSASPKAPADTQEAAIARPWLMPACESEKKAEEVVINRRQGMQKQLSLSVPSRRTMMQRQLSVALPPSMLRRNEPLVPDDADGSTGLPRLKLADRIKSFKESCVFTLPLSYPQQQLPVSPSQLLTAPFKQSQKHCYSPNIALPITPESVGANTPPTTPSVTVVEAGGSSISTSSISANIHIPAKQAAVETMKTDGAEEDEEPLTLLPPSDTLLLELMGYTPWQPLPPKYTHSLFVPSLPAIEQLSTPPVTPPTLTPPPDETVAPLNTSLSVLRLSTSQKKA